MKKVIPFAIILAVVAVIAIAFKFPKKDKSPAQKVSGDVTKTFYELEIKSLDGKETIKFSDFKGKKIMCVNVASECGYTYQYEDLQKLADKYKETLVLIGFPCNQFGGQEPGAPEDIEQFCKKNYGVTFRLSEKIDVKGENQHPVYQWLTKKVNNGVDDYDVKWNFNKFLLDENGNLLGYFGSRTKPLDEEIIKLIEKKAE